MNDYVFYISNEDLSCLASFRCQRNLSVLRQDDGCYLILRKLENLKNFNILPATKRYRLEQEKLYPLKGKVPIAELPQGKEVALKGFLNLSFPSCKALASQQSTALLRLKRDLLLKNSSNYLLCDLSVLVDYCENRAQVVYRDLKYLVSGRKCLVWGKSLPSIPGDLFYSYGRMILPETFRIEPYLSADDLGMFFPGQAQVFWRSSTEGPSLLADQWTPLTLASLRLNGGDDD